MFTYAPKPPLFLLFISNLIISTLTLLSIASKIGVLPALSAISIAEYTSTPYSIRTSNTSLCPFSIA
jgi:hypothetical protein